MTAAPLPYPVRLGEYELVRLIAHGGMADVYLARRTDGVGLERHVAVKVLSGPRAHDGEACALFLDEARLLAMLNHQNVGRVFDVDVADGVHYLAMEYVHGVDLREVLEAAHAANVAVPYEVALGVLSAAAAGLDHAHRRCDRSGRPMRLVHRDVSLSNIMVCYDGAVKVVDFGIATATVSSHHTNPGIVRGKASYMSPEQCFGDPVDLRTDVFALGIVLYELTTGRRCFPGATDFDRMLAIVHGEYVPPSLVVPGYPPELADIVARALALAPAARFPSAAAMIDALERVAMQLGWVAGPRAIARFMSHLFGEVPEPWTVARPRRLARGTESEATVSYGDEDEPTRGRRSMARLWPREPTPTIAA